MVDQTCIILPGTVRVGDALGDGAALDRECEELRRIVAKLTPAEKAELRRAVMVATVRGVTDGKREA
jgi:hypothetical protein